MVYENLKQQEENEEDNRLLPKYLSNVTTWLKGYFSRWRQEEEIKEEEKPFLYTGIIKDLKKMDKGMKPLVEFYNKKIESHKGRVNFRK